MFGRKQPTLEPKASEGDVLIQKTEAVTITKKTKVTVPSTYKAIAFIDSKPLFRIEPCANKMIVSNYGKEYLGKQLQIAFILPKTISQSAWGFGNVQVNNQGLKEAYRIGVNGKFGIEIEDYAKAIQMFPSSMSITMEQIREKSISTLKSVGTPLLGQYFSNTSTSVFQISALQGEFREKFLEALDGEIIFERMGLKVSMLTVDGFFVDEDDMETIRQRLNS